MLSADITIGNSISPAITVTQYQNGLPLADGSTVTLTLLSAPSGGALDGSYTAQVDQNGVATFAGLTPTAIGPYKLQASDGNDTVGNLDFDATISNFRTLVFTQQPTDFMIGSATPVPTFKVSVEDGNGNILNVSDRIDVTIDIPNGDVHSGTLEVQAFQGTATFNNFFANSAGPTTLEATDFVQGDGFSFTIYAFSKSFNVLPGSAVSVAGPPLRAWRIDVLRNSQCPRYESERGYLVLRS